MLPMRWTSADGCGVLPHTGITLPSCAIGGICFETPSTFDSLRSPTSHAFFVIQASFRFRSVSHLFLVYDIYIENWSNIGVWISSARRSASLKGKA